jgi:hypothetical protein
MSLDSELLLLSHDTTITCPRCATGFQLDRGFAKKALEQLADVSAGAIAAMRETERAEVEKRAEQLADQRARAAQLEAEGYKNLLKEQQGAHAKSLAEARALAEQSLEPKFNDMRRAMDAQAAQLSLLKSREDSVQARENDIESRVASAAQTKATELVAAERRLCEQQLEDKNTQVAALRTEQLGLRQEREKLQDEKASLALEVQRQVDVKLQQREASVRAQEQDKAHLEKAELQKKWLCH